MFKLRKRTVFQLYLPTVNSFVYLLLLLLPVLFCSPGIWIDCIKESSTKMSNIFVLFQKLKPSPISRWLCRRWATTRWWTCWRRRWWWPWRWSLPTRTGPRGEAVRRTTVCSVWVARGTTRTWRVPTTARSTEKLPLYRPLCPAAIGGGWKCSYQCYTVQQVNVCLS